MATMQSAIRSGRPEAVAEVLDMLGDSEATEELTRTYGGMVGPDENALSPDESGLLLGTTPILHAASSGQSAMFSAVLEAMRARQLMIPVSGDVRGHTVLSLAARSGSRETFMAVLTALQQDLAGADEVKEVLMRSDESSRTVLREAAKSGSIDTFEAALDAATRLAPWEVRGLIASTDSRGDTLLSAAVKSKNVDLFQTVLRRIKDAPGTPQTIVLLQSRCVQGCSLMFRAAVSGSVSIWDAVVEALHQNLETNQVTTMMTEVCQQPDAPLVCAARGGSTQFWVKVMLTLRTRVPNEVQTMLMARIAGDGSVLLIAASVGDVDFIRATITFLEDTLSTEQEQQMDMSLTTAEALLVMATTTEKPDFFEVVVTFLKRVWTHEQVGEMVMTTFTSFGEPVAASSNASEQQPSEIVYPVRRKPVGSVFAERGSYEQALVLGAKPDDRMYRTALRLYNDGCAVRWRLGTDGARQETYLQQKGKPGVGAGEPLFLTVTRTGDVRFFGVVTTFLEGALTGDQVREIIMSTSTAGAKLLRAATRSGDVNFFGVVIAFLRTNLTPEQMRGDLVLAAATDTSLWEAATQPASAQFFTAVINGFAYDMTNDQEEEFLTAQNGVGTKVLVEASRTGDIDFFKATVHHLMKTLTSKQVLDILLAKNEHEDSTWAEVIRQQGAPFFSAIVRCLPEIFTSAQVRELVFSRFNGRSMLRAAFEMKNARLLKAFPQSLEVPGSLEGNEVAETFDLHATFSSCAQMSIPLRGQSRRGALDVLSYLVASHARPSPDDLIKLSRSVPKASHGSFKTCCLRAVASAANPFIPGMSLSVELSNAANVAQEGEIRALTSLQISVDNLLLEILERLPPTVRGFHRGMDGCCAVFEPEYDGPKEVSTRIKGPLALALHERQQTETFCNVPLVMDFLSRRFTCGLPNLRDTDGVLRDPDELHDLSGGTAGGGGSLVIDRSPKLEGRANGTNDSGNLPTGDSDLPGRNSMLTRLLCPRALLQGADSSSPSLTFLPGAQFVAAGLVAKPCNYYEVPAMRMMLDFVVYVGMLAVFSIFVTYYEGGALNWGEIVIAVYIVAGCLREGREMWRGMAMYFRDRWNVLDVLVLLFLAAGLISSLGDPSNPWGHALYAITAPLFYARLLFFAQILRIPGPMIEVILSMTAELARFGTVMVVVMIGFAVSFHALFRNDDSFGGTLLNLFKAMLGEVGFFDDFSGGRDDAVATILLVAYLLIMTIMLLNLLVAILSTSHAKVQENVEREFRVSKARIIQQYRLVVEEHLLPAPFNLVQLVLSWIFAIVCCKCTRKGYTSAKKSVGRLVFWLVLGPLAAAAGSLLWMTSVGTFSFVWRKYYSEQMGSLVLKAKQRDDLLLRELLRGQDKGWPRRKFMFVTHLIIGIWCLVGAPLCLLALWVGHLVPSCVRRVCTDSDATQATSPDESTGSSRRASGPSERADGGASDRADVTTVDGTTDPTIKGMLERGAGGVGVDDLRKYLKDPMIDNEVREDEKKRGVTVEHLKLLRNRLERTLGDAQTATTDRLKKLAKEHADNKRKHAELKHKLGSVVQALHAKDKRLGHLEAECMENKQERAEIKDMLDSVLSALGGMRKKSPTMASGCNTNKTDARAPKY